MIYQNPYLPQQQFVWPAQQNIPMVQQPQMQYVPQQPMMQPQQQEQQSQENNSFIWVEGKEAAKAYLVAPGHSLLLMDSENPYIYMKSADKDGKPQKMRTYRLIEETDDEEIVPEVVENVDFAKKEDLKGFVKQEDFNLVLEELDSLRKQLSSENKEESDISTTSRRRNK